MEVQRKLFDVIQKIIPTNDLLANTISKLLNISESAAYKRIRGDQSLTLDEFYVLCDHFHLSLDSLLRGENACQFDCVYKPVNSPDEYRNYMLFLLKNFDRQSASGNLSILMSATDIPLFHLLPHKELRFFKLYTWAQSVYNYVGSLEEFFKEMETPEVLTAHDTITRDYGFIPSTEIWTGRTIEPTLKLIEYYIEINMFTSKDLPLALCKQLLSILDKLQQWVENGHKEDCSATFQLYESELDLENTYYLVKRTEHSNCFVKLFTINCFDVFDTEFCNEAERWLTKLTQRSIPLCGSSEKERVKFFASQREKVMFLEEKIRNLKNFPLRT